MEQIFKSDNEFRFKCPTFGSEVEFKDCIGIEAQFMKGQADETRGGCKACLTASRCPVPFMIKETYQLGGRYYSKEPVVGQLSAKVQERIERVLVIGSHIDAIPMSAAERAAIAAANATERKGAVKAVELSKPTRKTSTRPRASERVPNGSVAKDVVTEAMATAGEQSYAAAINTAIAKETSVEPAQPIASGGISAPEDQLPAILKPKKSFPLSPKPTGGMSLLELARMKKEQRAA